VIVWLWSAGSCEGVTGDHAKARKAAARALASSGTGTAVVEQAYFVSGTRSLSAGYERAGTRWVGRRRRGGQVSWRLCPAEPELAV
jgi:hypothetical protein